MGEATMPKTALISTRRVTGVFLAALLQAGFIWALVEGLDIKLSTVLPPIAVFIPKPVVAPPPAPPLPRDYRPPQVLPVAPTVVIEEPRGDTALTPNDPRPPQAGPAERSPVGLMATHTTPPYPALDARLGNQGTVLLRLVIGPDGAVRAASVVRSSGFAGLDQAAIAWVVVHWRYRPAERGGAAVESAANVAVSFNLKNGGN